MMKHISRYTSTLLRTAILLGALSFVNTPTKAQTTTLPDAFETMDPTTTPSIIGDGNWYYIQFYMGNNRCYLADRGEDVVMHSKDFLPFANDIQWTLVDAGSGKFKLKSRNERYVYYKSDESRFKCGSLSQADNLTIRKQSGGGGYEIHVDGDDNNAMRNFGSSTNVWGDIDKGQKNNARACMRIAKLKTNVAYIIYYQEPIYTNSTTPVNRNQDSRSGALGFSQPHYLTYSGTDTEAEGWSSLITNGNLENVDVSCFFTGNGVPINISDGKGVDNSRGFYIKSVAGQAENWSTQFFVRASETLSEGTTFLVEFDYKASKEITVVTQAHGEPNAYRTMISDLTVNFTTNWQHYSKKVTVNSDMASQNDFQTIAFCLGITGSEDVEFYFDNIVFSKDNRFRESDISSRSSILNTYNSWTLPIAASYHKDGLWDLEETPSGPGRFMIKKHGTSDYLKTTASGVGPLMYTLNSSNSPTVFELADPSALRYTLIKNVGTNNYMNYTGVQVSGGTAYDFDADGWYVFDYSEQNNSWKAGFLPVEVPNPNEDPYYQVVVKTGSQMLGTDAQLKTYSSFNPESWSLEQYGDNPDYQHFRLKNSAGQYYKNIGELTNDPTEASIYTNTDLNTLFTLEWVPKTETRIYHEVIHKESNVRLYYAYNPTTPARQKIYGQQGLITDADSEWMNEDGTQKVNEFKITHYVKKGETIEFGLPTTLGSNNDHRLYQRWYHYNDKTCNNTLYPDGSDLEGLKSHFKLKTSAGEVMSYLYDNGIVTGQKLDWPVVFPGANTYESHLFSYNNCDGNAFTLAADVSRYSDFEYKNADSHLDGNLVEPSLTMRYIFYMKDAKEMATNLMSCTGDKWLEEEKIIHFPATCLFYENSKSDAYKGEFIGIKHVFRDYWVFNGSGATDENLESAVINGTSGHIEVEVDDGGTGITLGGKNNKGYYLYDEGKTGTGNGYGDSRFIGFKYPDEEGYRGTVKKTGEENPAYLKVYFNYGGTKYQIAKFKLIFDEGTSTLPWISVNSSSQVKDTPRDPKQLGKIAGRPIAKITFDYPEGATFKNSSDYTIHNNASITGLWSEIANSSPLPLTFENTNYGFDGDNPSWGSYAMVTTMPTRYGHSKTTLPANDKDYGYNIGPDTGMQSAFLYIDASEQPGDICSVDFMGEFCPNDKLMCSGWISGSNRVINDNRCPGSVTITVKGERTEGGVRYEDDIYRFCPGQCYELNNGTSQIDGSGYYNNGSEWVYDGSADHVVWQQFYFEFKINKKYDRHWVEVNNNCVSSTGGDFMLDNIEVFAMVPEVEPEMNTPICLHKNGKTEMRLLKLTMGYDKLLVATGTNEEATENSNLPLGFVFLKKDVFLEKFQEGLKTYNNITISLADMETAIEAGHYKDIIKTASQGGYKEAYEYAFNEAMLGNKEIWDASNPTAHEGAGVLNFRWSNKFDNIEKYSFAKAVNNTKTIYGYTDPETKERILVMNGNYPQLDWETNTDYLLVTNTTGITNIADLYRLFNVCSDCNRYKVFQIKPPVQILSMESSDVTEELVVCEGKIPTLLTNLKGYNISGELVPLTNLNFDWWLGSETTLATLDNYHNQQNTTGTVHLDEALYILRIYYPDVTSLDGVVPRSSTNTTQQGYHEHNNTDPTDDDPDLTQDMIDYLKGLVNAGQLILHQKSISIPAEKVSDEDPYFYLVACPIHDGYFDKALNPAANKYVAYFCDEPQGLRIKVGEKAPSLKCGFVPNENGFSSYDYSTVNDAVLSIRLAKKEQFEEVQHGETTDSPATTYNIDATTDKHFLWLPIRNAEVESPGSTGVLRKSDDYDIYLASTDDPTWDQNIYTAMSQTIPKLPIVGKIVQLNAIDTKVNSSADQTSNRLCIYFTSNFEVREGYNYTLSLPFKEEGDGNACDGNILLNLKIVPDYEVWTGGAGNTDWNNDQNWRRADGNTSPRWNANDELYVGAAGENSPLKGYKTNDWNYRTDNDRVLRKGFAPLYCTHVLMKSDEWGNAPELYDALDGAGSFSASPFPNLRDTSTPILKFDMQARKWDIWEDTYGENSRVSDKGRSGDLLAEMYQINTCDEIAFQPATELRNAHLLNYNNAWVEYQLDMGRWYLLGSPLQGTIAGEWYAPTGTAQQKTTYYDDVTFGDGYDRYSPAIFQRSWDKAKAVLYEVGSTYSTNDNPNPDDPDLLDNNGALPGSIQQGTWDSGTWDVTGADEYLDRLGYKPMGDNKANVAIKGVWSNTYNDATVDYTKGGFSVMVLNNLKPSGNGNTNPAIIRLPKEDIMYDYYRFSETGAADGGTDTDLTGVRNDLNRAKNRGRLKTDLLLPESAQKQEKEASSYKYGDRRKYTRVPIKETDLTTMIAGIRNHQETVSAGISENMKFYLVENPFPCGLSMDQFFAANTGLNKKYWLLTETGQHLVQYAEESGEWIKQTGEPAAFVTANAVVAPGQGFFVEATTAGESTTITFNKDMQAQSRYGVKADIGTDYEIVVGTKQKMTTIPATYDHDNDPDTPEVPLMVDDDNDPSTPEVQATMEVPEVNNQGNYVIENITENVTVFNYVQTSETDKKYALKARTRSDEKDSPLGLVITAQRGNSQSSALVMQRESASNDFLPEEDTEVFINSDLEQVPTVYTLCGRLATTINSIHDFHCLPLGVESSSDAPCTLTFKGVEMLGDSIAFYDALEQKLTPLESGMQFSVSGQTQNRYYLIRSLDQKEAAEETHIQIFTKGLVATVIASTAEPITNVRCFDTAGRLVYSASPQTAEYSFNLPAAGIYIIEAQTEADHKIKKVMTK